MSGSGSGSIKCKSNSGSYNLLETERAVNQRDADEERNALKCVVHFLDDSTQSFNLDVSIKLII